MAKRRKPIHPDAPLLYPDHAKPVSRRDFIRQGILSGAGMVMAPTLLGGLLGGMRDAHALAGDVTTAVTNCGINFSGGNKIPFICFDLAGGASIAGNVLGGQAGGQLDALSTAGYSRMGIPGDMLPSMTDPGDSLSYTDTSCGLAFHKDSGFLRGIQERAPGALANTNGALIAARSDNDTGNNPHNPMYGIHKAGAYGELLKLIGSRNTDSGGNSMSPAMMINAEARPTKVDRRTDATGLVDTGDLSTMFPKSADTVNVMESIYRISNAKLGRVSTDLTNDTEIKDRVNCEYVKSAALVENYSDPTALDPEDGVIVAKPGDPDAGTEIFTRNEYDNDREFQKAAAVMKLAVNGYAGAGTITMGGYDYHTGDRAAGELRDLRAGRCIGACLDYARRVGKPIMIYVFSDGSVFSNGSVDNSANGRGKGVWTGDNSGTAGSFFLVYDPRRRPALTDPSRQQIGYYSAGGSVVTSSSPCANNVNLLVETVVLNYMALHSEQNLFSTTNYFPNHGLGNGAMQDSLTAFQPLYNGTLASGI